MVEKWAGKIESLEVAFKKIDQDQSGTIDFDEFCDWAIKRSFKNNNYDLDDINEQVGIKVLFGWLLFRSSLEENVKVEIVN